MAARAHRVGCGARLLPEPPASLAAPGLGLQPRLPVLQLQSGTLLQIVCVGSFMLFLCHLINVRYFDENVNNNIERV